MKILRKLREWIDARRVSRSVYKQALDDAVAESMRRACCSDCRYRRIDYGIWGEHRCQNVWLENARGTSYQPKMQRRCKYYSPDTHKLHSEFREKLRRVRRLRKKAWKESLALAKKTHPCEFCKHSKHAERACASLGLSAYLNLWPISVPACKGFVLDEARLRAECDRKFGVGALYVRGQRKEHSTAERERRYKDVSGQAVDYNVQSVSDLDEFIQCEVCYEAVARRVVDSAKASYGEDSPRSVACYYSFLMTAASGLPDDKKPEFWRKFDKHDIRDLISHKAPSKKQ